MIESILSSVKKSLGIPPMDDYFDNEIAMHINSVFVSLNQIGVGPKEGFSIDTASESYWDDFLPNDSPKLNNVKTYMCLKVKEFFDPASSSAVRDAMDRQIQELEWRISVTVDPPGDIE